MIVMQTFSLPLGLMTVTNELLGSRDSAIGIATGYGLDGRVGIRAPVGSKFFSPRGPDRF
jgi:hypothetical protein